MYRNEKRVDTKISKKRVCIEDCCSVRKCKRLKVVLTTCSAEMSTGAGIILTGVTVVIDVRGIVRST